MSVKIEKQAGSKVLMEFNVEKEKFNKALDEAFVKNAKNFKFPGFRKGKVPRNVIEKTYGEGILYDEAFGIIADEEYAKAVEENKLNIVSKPEVDIKEIGKDKDLVFTVVVYVKPEATIENYKGIKIDKVDIKVTAKDVEEELKKIQSKNARISLKEDGAAQNGDITVIDFEGFLDGKPFDGGKAERYELEIGSGNFIPGFEEQLIGMKTGEEKDINTKFPDEYHSEELAGKDTVFKIKLHEIKRKDLPKLDDEFAKDVSEYETLESYKESIKERLEKSKITAAKAEKENKILDKIAELVKVEIPEPMIDSKIDSMMEEFKANLSYQGMTIEQYMELLNVDEKALRQQFKTNAVKDIKVGLAMEAIDNVEKIEVTAEDIDKKIDELASQYGQDGATLKSNENAREYMKGRLREEKILEFLVSNAVEK